MTPSAAGATANSSELKGTTVTGVEEKGNTVSIAADWKSNYFTGPGRFVFVLKGDKIRDAHNGRLGIQ